MEIVTLTPEQFDKFSYDHPLHSFYQTSMYANLMVNYGYKIRYYGIVNDENALIGGAMVMIQKLFGSFKYAYSPRGILIDYDNKALVAEITKRFKKILSKEKCVFFKIDPLVVNNKRDNEGKIIPSSYKNDTIEYLQKIGYNYFGENKFFGTLKPRWNAVLKVIGSSKSLFENFDRQVKNKVRKALSRGVVVYEGSYKDIELFYSFVAKKHYRKLDYYQNFSKSFGDYFKLFFAKLDSEKYLQNVKDLYEKELINNEKINDEMREAGAENNISEKLTNTKITSDKLLSTYKKELIFASELFEQKPDGIIIGACAIILDKNGIELLIEGLDQNYGLYYPTFLLKWHIINKYAKQGAIYIDLNAITGYFDDNNKYKGLNDMKLGYGADVVEYIGEFDLIINHGFYSLYNKTKIWNRLLRSKIK